MVCVSGRLHELRRWATIATLNRQRRAVRQRPPNGRAVKACTFAQGVRWCPFGPGCHDQFFDNSRCLPSRCTLSPGRSIYGDSEWRLRWPWTQRDRSW